VALALGSPIGTGGAAFRHLSDAEVDTPSGFTGVWRREVLERHGGWDEGWPINQDSELAARIRKAGGRIVCVPQMTARYIPRDSFKALARQYLRYGLYRAKTSARHPETVRTSHLLPPALVLTLLGALLGPQASKVLARVAVLLYALTIVGESLRLARESSPREALALPAVFATMHVAWGVGLLHGAVRYGVPAIRSR